MAALDKLSVPDLLRQYLTNLILGTDPNSLRFSGGKTAYVGTVTASGDNVVITPPVGKSIRVFWVYTLANPDSPTTEITVSIGAMPIYISYGIAHWEPFTGAVNDSVVINLSVSSNVACTIHYSVV